MMMIMTTMMMMMIMVPFSARTGGGLGKGCRGEGPLLLPVRLARREDQPHPHRRHELEGRRGQQQQVCLSVRACVRACLCVCVCVLFGRVGGGGGGQKWCLGGGGRVVADNKTVNM